MNNLLGPDSQGHYEVTIVPEVAGLKTLVLDFYASELPLRGDGPVEQPHRKDGDVLCWNGEASSTTYIPMNSLTELIDLRRNPECQHSSSIQTSILKLVDRSRHTRTTAFGYSASYAKQILWKIYEIYLDALRDRKPRDMIKDNNY